MYYDGLFAWHYVFKLFLDDSILFEYSYIVHGLKCPKLFCVLSMCVYSNHYRGELVRLEHADELRLLQEQLTSAQEQTSIYKQHITQLKWVFSKWVLLC